MSLCIERAKRWFTAHPKARQYAWFVVLWVAGLLAAFAATYPIKWLIRSMG